MKKYFICLAALFLCFTLCGCSVLGEKTKDDRNFMVSAIGFETDGALISVSVEAIIINSELAESEPVPEVLTATGITISEALDSIGSSLAKPMILNHCGVIVIGERMTKYWFDKICDYCFYENRITLSAYMISAESPAELLSGEPESSVAVGYDIMGIIEQQSTRTGISYNSRYFEVEGLREKGKKVFSLPHFIRNDGGISVDGLAVFKDDALVTQLDNSDAGLYALITGRFNKGTVRFGTNEYHINSRKIDYGYSDVSGNKILLKLQLSGDSIDGDVCQKLENELESLEYKLKLECGTDVFGFSDILTDRFSEFREKHAENYAEFYRTAAFCAECSASGGAKNDG